jgi:hypothetical protein
MRTLGEFTKKVSEREALLHSFKALNLSAFLGAEIFHQPLQSYWLRRDRSVLLGILPTIRII